ncbi:restriction endonuclease subunit S [Bacillus toyonensis]|uniref:restriction endonuclease subunit S n=1 Tax=Bacillus toyonensis TaxID=155322 RepID=UPI000BEB30DB|nr:restriction endonuclease subunit S [Bacillus toyonensis]PDZ86114.1 restriction endonuclease subunit S [Bacillus toyonensis]PEA71052.1 restriction endonuclease subunit S [Bacillus toyonensis]
MNVPKLRFKEFIKEWGNSTLSNLTNSLEAGVSVNSEDIPVNNQELGILKTSCINSGVFFPQENKRVIEEDINRVKNSVKKNTLIVSRMNTPQLVGEIGYVKNDYKNLYLPDRLWELSPNLNIVNAKWLALSLNTFKNKFLIRSLGTGTSGSMKNISKPAFLNIFINIPKITEQNKIADFFTKLDDKIHLQQEKVNLLKEQKKGYMQKIFKQEIRFKDNHGEEYPEWRDIKLNTIATKISKKNKELAVTNVISNSAKNGLISQQDYFDKDIANQENIGGYYIISKGDFVYNPRISLEAPYGPINIYHGVNDGIVSPLYTCFRIEDKQINKDFIYYYFKSSLWHRYIYINGDSGARHDRISIKDSAFFEMDMFLPCQKEQEKIVRFLTKIDERIQLEQQKMNDLQEQKKGLMQQMFI